MSFYSEASLAYVASAGASKDGKAYSMKPVDGTGDFTFSRGSNLAATRVGPTGLIEKGRENLLLQSNQFDTTWVNSNTTETSGQAGYDGTNDAWLLSKSAANGMVYQSISSSGVQTISIYAKKGTNSWMQIYAVGSSNVRAYYDLENGVLGGYALNAIERKIEDVGNDWYRCSVTFNSSLSAVRFFVSDGSNNDSGTSGSIYIQDAQLEIGLAATEVIESGATTGKAGLLEDEPRFDYSGGATCPSLLLEPSRTNSYASSEWILNLDADLSQEVSDVDSPIENTPFLKITKNTSGLSRQLLYTSTNGDIDTCSVFAKKGSAGGNQIYFSDGYYGSSTMTASFDLDTGSWFVTPSGTALVDYGFENFGNGMYRIWVAGRTMDSANPDSTRWREPALFFDNGQLSVGEYIYITGLQTERNSSYPTSYIPNHSGGSVTRGADSCTGAGDATTFNDSQGVLFAEISALANDGTFRNISVSNGTTAQAIRIYYRSNDDQITFLLGSSSGGGITTSIPSATDYIKVAAKYDTDTIKLFVNGALINTISSLTMPTGLQQLDFNIANVLPFYGNAKQVLYFPTALSDADCITLTT